MTINYDNRFNQNEWFVIGLLSFYIVIFLLPKRFQPMISALFILFGPAAALFMDHAISVSPIDFYDVNDSSKYEIFDFLLYFGYGPFNFLLVYIFDTLKLEKQHLLFYIPACCVVALGSEWLAVQLGVFHYKNGYQIIYSFPIYLVTFSILFLLYFKLNRREKELMR